MLMSSDILLRSPLRDRRYYHGLAPRLYDQLPTAVNMNTASRFGTFWTMLPGLTPTRMCTNTCRGAGDASLKRDVELWFAK
jgi:hypothetical protein